MAQIASSAPTPEADRAVTRATVFGLTVRSDRRIALLEGSSITPSRRTLSVFVHDAHSPHPDWPAGGCVICTRRDGDEPESFRIDSHPEDGYLLWGRARGSYQLSLDGRQVHCYPEPSTDRTWQRFLVGQVLPFAALVSGLEIFHASSVTLAGRAVAFLGRSGAGKTSLAMALYDAGAGFLADDVLALECHGDELLAHPGTPLAGVPRSSTGLGGQATQRPERVLMSTPRESVLRVNGGAREAPVQALFFLDRRLDGPRKAVFEPVSDPRALLAATFNFVLATPRRLRGLLDVCALAARLRVERIVAGPAVDASQLAAAVERRLGSGS